VQQILGVVGDKWALLVLEQLGVRTQRFSELLRAVPAVSPRMLTQTLRQLERDGMVERTLRAAVPPRVDYRLTELGTSVLAPVCALCEWGRAHQDVVLANRASHDQQAAPGAAR
jgi:DNA-binding HxlR family transcriptional regulator